MNLTAVGLLVAVTSSALAQTPIDPQTLAQLRSQYAEATRPPEGLTPTPQAIEYYGIAPLPPGVTVAEGSAGPRGAVDLYVGLRPSPPGNGFWFWTLGGSEVVYWALDDGMMGANAVDVGGGHVTELEFSFGLHADDANDTLRPYIIVSFYNAPYDPVADATDPVVEPPTPVSSVGVIFDPITLPAAGFYAVRSGLLDLAAAGLEFDLDETFYVEIFPLEWSSYPDGSPVFDPDVFAVFTGPATVTYGTNQDRMWSDCWVRGIGGVIVPGDGDFLYDHPAEMDVGGFSPYLNRSGIILGGLECPGPILELSINEPDDICVKPGDPVTVTLSMSCIPGLVRGFQAFLSFDTSALTFDSGSYTSEPFGLPIIDPIAAVGGDIDVAAGIDDLSGQPPTSTTADLVVLNFFAGSTEGPTTVDFDGSHDPPTRLSDEFGNAVVPTLFDSPTILVDGTGPVFDQSCPLPAINVNADAGTCEASGATVNPTTATATDNLDPSPTVTFVRSDSKPNLTDPYEASDSPITITWTATDCAGNSSTCQQVVTVSAYNDLVLDIKLSPTVETPLTRCITFELWECPATVPTQIVELELTFTSGRFTDTVDVPCGTYTCITARDKLHTLRRTIDPLPMVGVQWAADFVTPGKDLIGGNLNDDYWIDILDFGVFSSQWGLNYGTGDTTCSTPFPHADITGDGSVGTGDFTFIQINFLLSHEGNCCGQPSLGEGDGPVTAISVEELDAMGLSQLAAGDLNGDGWLDAADIAAFLAGARPKPPLQPVEPVENLKGVGGSVGTPLQRKQP